MSISNYFFSKETVNILLGDIIACVLELTHRHVCIRSDLLHFLITSYIDIY